MKKLVKLTLQCIALMAGFLILTSSGCKEDELINAEFNQYSREVENILAFNGATCLVCIDVHAMGMDENLKWALRANANPAEPQWTTNLTEAAIIQEINRKIAACPAGSNVKLQFMYHLDSKPQYHFVNDTIKHTYNWFQHLSVEAVLQRLAQAGNTQITKVYLTSCSSQSRTSTVNAAFGLTNVTHVVTVDDTILLGCGSIAGAKYPTFEPQEVKIIVWIKEGDKQIAQIPDDAMDEDNKFDIGSNSVVPR